MLDKNKTTTTHLKKIQIPPIPEYRSMPIEPRITITDILEFNGSGESRTSKIQQLLNNGYQFEFPLLSHVVLNDQKAVLKALEDTSVNQNDANGCTAITYAAAIGQLKLVKTLHRKGAKIGSSIYWKVTPSGRIPLGKITPLYLAVYRGHIEITQYLLKHDPLFVKKRNRPHFLRILKVAALNGRIEITSYLLTQYKTLFDKQIANFSTLLVKLIQLGSKLCKTHVAIIKLLLEHGASLTVRDTLGYTPFLLATVACQLEITNLLLSEGANIHDKDYNGNTALILAVRNRQLQVVKYLLASGASITVKNHKGDTVFSLAQKNQDEEMCQYLKNFYDKLLNVCNLLNLLRPTLGKLGIFSELPFELQVYIFKFLLNDPNQQKLTSKQYESVFTYAQNRKTLHFSQITFMYHTAFLHKTNFVTPLPKIQRTITDNSELNLDLNKNAADDLLYSHFLKFT